MPRKGHVFTAKEHRKVEHVKASNPDVCFTTVSYPIKGTPYFDAVKDRVSLPIAWAEATDRDYSIGGRHGKEYYRLADTWLRNEVEASRLEATDPAAAAQKYAAAAHARQALASVAEEREA